MWISGERNYLHELRKQIKIHKFFCHDDLQEPQRAFFDLTQFGTGPYTGIIENQEIRKVCFSETHASGNREAFTHND